MISLRSVAKFYGSACAVSDLSFDVGPGEIVGLIGPNGAGKTSALRCIAGIHRIVIINKGLKVADGTMAELADKARLAGSTLERIFLDVTSNDGAA